MFRFKWHHFGLDRDYFKTPTPERNWDEARFKLISLQICLPAASTTSASRICRLAEMKISSSFEGWQHTDESMAVAGDAQLRHKGHCFVPAADDNKQTNTQCGPILFGPSEQEEECFSGGLRAIRICTLRRWGRFNEGKSRESIAPRHTAALYASALSTLKSSFTLSRHLKSSHVYVS